MSYIGTAIELESVQMYYDFVIVLLFFRALVKLL